jgi:hypothetical protein
VRALLFSLVALFQGATDRPAENPGAIAIVLDTSIALHVELSAALQRELPFRTVERTLSQPWLESTKPVATITLVPGAQRWVESFATDRPHAALLRWSNDPLIGDRSPQLLIGSAHTEATCTSKLLSQRSRGDGADRPLVIWASPTDKEAAQIAKDRGAVLVTGGATELSERIDTQREGTTDIFIRGEPSLSRAVILERLGYLSLSPAFEVGSDAPGTARFGVAQWIHGDLDGHAKQVSRWLRRQIRSKRRRPKAAPPPGATHISLPCTP